MMKWRDLNDVVRAEAETEAERRAALPVWAQARLKRLDRLDVAERAARARWGPRWFRKLRAPWPKMIFVGSEYAIVFGGMAINLKEAEADLLVQVLVKLGEREPGARVWKKDLGIRKGETAWNVWQDLNKKLPFMFDSKPGPNGGVRQLLPLYFGGADDALDQGA